MFLSKYYSLKHLLFESANAGKLEEDQVLLALIEHYIGDQDLSKIEGDSDAIEKRRKTSKSMEVRTTDEAGDEITTHLPPEEEDLLGVGPRAPADHRRHDDARQGLRHHARHAHLSRPVIPLSSRKT